MGVVLITGANRGIGFELAKRFTADQWTVYACCRNPREAEALAALKTEGAGAVEILPLDVVDPRSIDQLKRAVGDTSIDLLINNAGIYATGNACLSNLDGEEWLASFAVNTIAPFLIAKTFLSNLKMADNGHIVTLSSQMGALSRERRENYAYCSSKAALNKASRMLAMELEPTGVAVTLIHPGWVQTDMGGPGADLTPEEAVEDVYRLIRDLTMADNGRFLTWKGEDHPW